MRVEATVPERARATGGVFALSAACAASPSKALRVTARRARRLVEVCDKRGADADNIRRVHPPQGTFCAVWFTGEPSTKWLVGVLLSQTVSSPTIGPTLSLGDDASGLPQAARCNA